MLQPNVYSFIQLTSEKKYIYSFLCVLPHGYACENGWEIQQHDLTLEFKSLRPTEQLQGNRQEGILDSEHQTFDGFHTILRKRNTLICLTSHLNSPPL